jgi:starch synthase
MPEKLKVLFVSSELSPLAKASGLADIIGSLPQILNSMDVDARIVIPKYGIINTNIYPAKLLADKVPVSFSGSKEEIGIYQINLPPIDSHVCQEMIVYLIDNQKYISEDGIYHTTEDTATRSSEDAGRFIFFTKAVLEIFDKINWVPNILHCHDWQTSLMPLLAQKSSHSFSTMMTIHNLAEQGEFQADLILNMLGQELVSFPTIKQRLEKSDTINCLEQGILNANIITAVSPTYSSEIMTKEHGCGLEETLNKRRPNLFGILNGIDNEQFNPETDQFIAHNFLPTNLDGKSKNKLDLQKELGLKIDQTIPMISMVSRLIEQKGLDILLPAIKKLAKENIQFIFLGAGKKSYEKDLKNLSKFKNIYVKIGYDESLAHRIYASSDMFLMPSHFEPCGLGQLISMRYGTVPIVRSTGGLKDTVSEINQNDGSGFLFYAYDSAALIDTIKHALSIYADQKTWQKIQKRIMELDFSWSNSAKKYLDLYRRMS